MLVVVVVVVYLAVEANATITASTPGGSGKKRMMPGTRKVN